MNYRRDKLERLARVAHLYYEEDKTQGEIAELMCVSRPLVSRMLNEARNLGIVEIRVHSPARSAESLAEHLCRTYGLRSSMLVAEEESDDITNYTMAKRLLTYIEEQKSAVVGVGWGTVIGIAAKMLERVPVHHNSIQTLCPLLGNSNVLLRQYHSDENVRMLAEAYDAQPVFLHAPAYYSCEADAKMMRETKQYQNVVNQWEKLDLAIIEIHDDSIIEKTGYLGQEEAVGYAAGYGVDVKGNIIPQAYNIMRIPLEMLERCRRVIGICAAGTSVQAVDGILRSGLITDVLAQDAMAELLLRETE